MIIRITLLSAAAALALPAAMAGAQQPAPTAPPPLGALNPGTQANVPVPPIVPPVETPVAGDATETTAQLPQNQADAAVQAEAAVQTQTPPPAATPAPAPTPAPAQTQAEASVQAGPISLATAADLRTGAQVRDQTGGLVGTIEATDPGGAVVSTGSARARLTLDSFGRNNQGLVIAMTKAQFEAAATAANPG